MPAKRKRVTAGAPAASEESFEISQLQVELEETRLKLQQEMEKARSEREDLEFKLQRTQKQARHLEAMSEEQDQEIAKVRGNALAKRTELESKLQTGVRERSELSLDLASAREEQRELQSKLEHAESMLEHERSAHQKQQAEFEQRLTQSEEIRAKLEQELGASQREHESTQRRLATAEQRGASAGDADAEAAALNELKQEREVGRGLEREVRDLKRKVKQLSGDQQNSELLQQQKAEAERQRDRALEKSREHMRLQGNYKMVRDEQRQCEAVLTKLLDSDGGAAAPADTEGSMGTRAPALLPVVRQIAALVDDMRRERVRIVDAEGKWRTKKQEAELQRDTSAQKLAEEQKRRGAAEKQSAHAEAEREMLQQRGAKLHQQIARLQKQNEQQHSALITSPAGGAGGAGAGDGEAALRAHIDELKSQLTEVVQRADAAQQMLDERVAPQELQSVEARVTELEAQEKAWHKERGQLEKKLEQAQVQNAQLDARVAQGEFNRATTKVLHLRHNPTSQAAQAEDETKAALQRENEKLKEQLRLMEERSAAAPGSSGAASGMTPWSARPGPGNGSRVPAAATPAGDPDLRKLNQRLKEKFREQILRFRDAVYIITGWKIDMKPPQRMSEPTTVTMRSMYAALQEDKLVFQSLHDGDNFVGFDIMGTSFFHRIDPRVKSLLKLSSVPIPAFISAVTTDLFEKQTMQ